MKMYLAYVLIIVMVWTSLAGCSDTDDKVVDFRSNEGKSISLERKEFREHYAGAKKFWELIEQAELYRDEGKHKARHPRLAW